MADKKALLDAIGKIKTDGKQRKFTESIELILNFKGINFKKQENQIDVKVNFPHATGKASGKVLLFAKDKEFISNMLGKVSKIIPEQEIQAIDKKTASLLANEYDILLAEGPVVLTVGKFLGQILAPKGKMPKPVQTNVSSVEAMIASMKASTRITNKKGKFMPVVQVRVGNEKMANEQLAENIQAAYDSVVNVLPGKKYNLKSVLIKKTMGKPMKVGEML